MSLLGLEGKAKVLRLIQEGTTLGATDTTMGGTSVDCEDAREGLLIIDIDVGSDVPTALNLEVCETSDGTFTDSAVTITASDLAADGINVYNVTDLKRYARITWTRADSNADTTWAVYLVAFDFRQNPPSATTAVAA